MLSSRIGVLTVLLEIPRSRCISIFFAMLNLISTLAVVDALIFTATARLSILGRGD